MTLIFIGKNDPYIFIGKNDDKVRYINNLTLFNIYYIMVGRCIFNKQQFFIIRVTTVFTSGSEGLSCSLAHHSVA